VSTVERRRHVRLKPVPELPARAVLLGEGLVHESLGVIDVSVSGIALATTPGVKLRSGDRAKLRLSLDHYGEYVVEVVARWTSGDAVGVELVDPAPEAKKAVHRYVGELLERGAPP